MSTQPGQRKMNWVWYVGASPAVRDDLLEDLPGRAAHELHPMFARLLAAPAEPFLQPIVDLGVPQTVFDRTVLIGDAAFVVRPHIAGGAAKAARDAHMIAAALAHSPTDIDGALLAFGEDQRRYGRQMLTYGTQLGRQWARL
jgi:2,6-dihydroxypyridine 3-monooxygenase